MTQHTPGPWGADIRKWNLAGQKMRGTWVITKDGYQPIARINGIGPSAQANARLIAAAPDLLAALEQTVRALGHISWVNYADDPRTEECKRAWIAGNAAIEKAGGDSVGAPSAKAEEGS